MTASTPPAVLAMQIVQVLVPAPLVAMVCVVKTQKLATTDTQQLADLATAPAQELARVQPAGMERSA